MKNNVLWCFLVLLSCSVSADIYKGTRYFKKVMSMGKTVLYVLLILSSCSASAGFYRAKYNDVWELISSDISQILVMHGLCKDRNDCNKKDLFFLEPEMDGLHVNLYSISDTEVIRDIIGCVLSIHEKNNASATIILSAYKGIQPVNMDFLKSLFFGNEPFLTFTLKEK